MQLNLLEGICFKNRLKMTKKRFLSLLFSIFLVSCFNRSFENFSFNELIIDKNAKQLNTKFIEGLDPLTFEEFLTDWDFTIEKESFSPEKLINKEFIKNHSGVSYIVNMEGNLKIKSIRYKVESKIDLDENALNFLVEAASLKIPQVNIEKIKKWTKNNIPLVNEKFSKATILSNIYYRLQKPEKNKFILTVKNYGA